MEPAAARTDTIRQSNTKKFNHIHFQLKARICSLDMCIWIGKYTVSGQNEAAPRRPRIALKNGRSIASTMVSIT